MKVSTTIKIEKSNLRFFGLSTLHCTEHEWTVFHQKHIHNLSGFESDADKKHEPVVLEKHDIECREKLKLEGFPWSLWTTTVLMQRIETMKFRLSTVLPVLGFE